jgi:polygalacturonase
MASGVARAFPAFASLLAVAAAAASAAPYVADVTAFGAKGDGVTRDTAAIAAAIAAVAAHGGGVLLFPTGTYLSAPLNLTSDCELRLVNATLRAVADFGSWPIVAPLPRYGRGRDFPGPRYGAFLQLNNLTRVAIVGEGGEGANVIDGQGDAWWSAKKNGTLRTTPGHLIETMWSSDIEITGVTLVDSPFWNVHLWSSSRLWVHDVRVRAPGDSPNTDGFDPDSSSHVLIERVDVENGDDCLAVKSGWDGPGVAYGQPSTNITFRDALCNSPNGAGNCVAVGSEMSGGVDGVFVSNVTCVNSGCLLDVKSTLGRGGYIRNVNVSDCVITGSLATAVRAADDYGDNNGPVNRTLVPVVGAISVARVRSAPGAKIAAAGFFEGLSDTAPGSGMITGVVLQDIALGGAAPAGSYHCVNVSGSSSNVVPAPCAALHG